MWIRLINRSPTCAPLGVLKKYEFFRTWKDFHVRKNALFYKTSNGAHVGDLFMSLIHTCELEGVNPFDYLTELQRHADDLATSPASWMPWRYRDTLQQFGTSLDSG